MALLWKSFFFVKFMSRTELLIIYLKEQVTAFSMVLQIQYVNSIPCIKIEYMYQYIVYFLIHFSDMVCQKIMTQKTKPLVIHVGMKTASIARKWHLRFNLSLISHIMLKYRYY